MSCVPSHLIYRIPKVFVGSRRVSVWIASPDITQKRTIEIVLLSEREREKGEGKKVWREQWNRFSFLSEMLYKMDWNYNNCAISFWKSNRRANEQWYSGKENEFIKNRREMRARWIKRLFLVLSLRHLFTCLCLRSASPAKPPTVLFSGSRVRIER